MSDTRDATINASAPVTGIILAAGRGTRMGELTKSLPKPLLPVLEKPAIEWVIDGMITAGIRRIVIVIGYLGDRVVDALTGYRSDSVELLFVRQDEQLGTAHALKLTRDAAGESPVLLAFADIMTSSENFAAMVQKFHDESCDLTAAVRDAGDPWRAAAVYVDAEWNIDQIIEKPPVGTSTTPWSHAGMYCFANSIYNYLSRVKPSSRGEYEVTDAVQMMISEKLRCRAVELHGYWKDLATPEDIIAAEEMISRTGIFTCLDNLDNTEKLERRY